jgi:carbamoyltransferase
LFTIAEERISRIKHHYGFPEKALKALFESTGIRPEDISIVAFSGLRIWYPSLSDIRIVGADGAVTRPPWLTSAKRRVANLVGLNPQAKHFAGMDERNPENFEGYLREIGVLRDGVPVYHVAHHRAHASTAFRLSGYTEAAVITLDGKGDGLAGTLYHGRSNGDMTLLRSTPAEGSLGAFYQAVTEALGFMPADGEFKTMGLAALGKPNGKANPFEGTMRSVDGVLQSSQCWTYSSYNAKYPGKAVPNPVSRVDQSDLYSAMLADFSPEQFAFLAQEHFEVALIDYIAQALELTGEKKLCGAGGAMLNVKGNSLARRELGIDDFFIYPDSPDSGLAVGAAMEALHQEGLAKLPCGLRTPYLGTAFTAAQVDESLARHGDFEIVPLDGPQGFRVVAEHIAAGEVLGSFVGAMEMGPRALGNRSVLADPRDERTKDRINLLLKGREPFVPFAPVVLEDDASQFWDGSIEYRYMTFSVDANDYAKKTVPVVVHVDGSMRPQVVSDSTNPWLYRLLNAFKEITGVGVLVNTSFNRHGLPICGHPDDAIEHLVKGWVDGLVFEHVYVRKQKPVS